MRHAVTAFIGAAIGTLAVLVLLPWLEDIFRRIQPPDDWVTFENLHVDDAIVGGPFIVTAERTIHKSTLAKVWTTVRRKEFGGLVTVCKAYDERHIIPEQIFPAKVDLAYWVGEEEVEKCEPNTPGVYQITMWIEITDQGGKVVSSIELYSNEFTVSAPEAP